MNLDGGQRQARRGRRLGRIARVLAIAFAAASVQGTAGGLARLAVAGETHSSKKAEARKAEAKAEFEKAQLHYRLGRFEEALKSYTRAYELFNAPALLFNIGQCHKNLQNHERAIFFFEGYLREENDADKRALAEELIAVSRAQLERQRRERPPVDPVPPPAVVVPVAPPPAPEPPAPVTAAPPPPSTGLIDMPPPAPVLVDTPGADAPPADEQPVYRTWWFWTAIGAGVAIATGAAIYYATGPTTTVSPMGTVGTLDRRR